MNNVIAEYHQIIRDNPDDDGPRWVLADYYEENGDLDRASLIRLQVERANLPHWHVDAVHLELRERALLAANEERWRRELSEAKGHVWGRFHRGFVGKLALNDAALLKGEVFAQCLQDCPIFGLALRWPRLKGRPTLPVVQGVRELTIVGTLMDVDDMKWLADSELLASLHSLNLVETGMDAEALEALLASPHLGGLRALRMPLHSFGNDGVDALIQSSLPSLVELDLSVATEDELGSGGRYEETMDSDAAKALATWSGLDNLHTLDMTGNQLGVGGMEALLASPKLANLKSLSLRSMADFDYDEDGKADVLPALAILCTGVELEELHISENDLTESAAAALTKAPALKNLKVLSIDRCSDGDGFEAVFAAPWLQSLQVLSMSDTSCDSLLSVLGRDPKNLHTIQMQSNYYWSQFESLAKTLASLPPNETLLQLNLGESRLEDLGELGKIKSLPGLKSLQIGRINQYGDEPVLDEAEVESFSSSAFGAQLVSLTTGFSKHDRLPIPELVSLGDGHYQGRLHLL